MISSKRREIRRGKTSKLTKNLERTYKAKKCRECKVVVTRMDFAKILGKFTKVKIQYESSSKPKSKQAPPQSSPNSNARLKRNENGMVLINRNSYNQHPAKDLVSSRKPRNSEVSSRNPLTSRSVQRDINILKENNRQKRSPPVKENVSNVNHSKQMKSDLKQYGIIFVNPSTVNNYDKNKITLLDLLPFINKNILPSDEWCIDYFPKSEEPKDDKIYDRIAAELEDLMYNEKKDSVVENKNEGVENKNEAVENNTDDFPSIMDILNDNNADNSFKINDNDNLALKPNLESSDVEAMLLGKSNEINKIEVTPLASDNNSVEKNLNEDVEQFSAIQEPTSNQEESSEKQEESSVNQDESSVNQKESSVNHEESSVNQEESSMNQEELPVNHEEPSVNEEELQKKEVTQGESTVNQEESTVNQEESALTPEINNKSLETIKVNSEAVDENPNSPSILDEALQKGIEEHLPTLEPHKTANGNTEESKNNCSSIEINVTPMEIDTVEEAKSENNITNSFPKTENNQDISISRTDVTHVVFNHVKNEKCVKSVTCPKNLKYTIELDAKLVEFIGAPKYITSLEDLQVLLQIVNDSEVDSLHVSHL